MNRSLCNCDFLRCLAHVVGRALRYWALTALLLLLLLTLTVEGPAPGDLDPQIKRMVSSYRFNFVGWEITAGWGKLTHALVVPQRYMDAASRHDFLLDYLRLIGEIQQQTWDIHQVYVDPAEEDPDAATAGMRARLAQLREEQQAHQALAEAILEEQTACTLNAAGFGVLGQQIPPVGLHFTPLPTLLIVSPRDHIERILALDLQPGLDAAQREAIESKIDADYNVSSLITNIGGLSAYPAMILESSSLNWVTEVAAHEWTHHYLTPHPLGWNYNAHPDTRTINETVASIVGKEIGRETIARYYPEYLPAEPSPTEGGAAYEGAETPPPFDFQREMHATRVQVDELLAAGRIEEAEAYMESRRQEFVAHGYPIRKLNQAYFAFYGAYADEPGAAGADPIGPLVQELRRRSDRLHDFVRRIASVTTRAELEELLKQLP